MPEPVRMGLTVSGVSLAVTEAVSLGGIVLGYTQFHRQEHRHVGLSGHHLAKRMDRVALPIRRNIPTSQELSGHRKHYTDFRWGSRETGLQHPWRTCRQAFLEIELIVQASA